jgi:purine-nucleoside/S-methyl-5'-thioadenosine phosphorylase / adenosine deaminase
MNQRTLDQLVQNRIQRSLAFPHSQRLVQQIHGIDQVLMLWSKIAMFTLKTSVQRNVPVATDIFPSRSEYLWAGRHKITKVGTFLYHGSVPTRAPNKTRITILRAQHLSKLPWLLHGFSTRVGGSSRAYGKDVLNLGFTKEDDRPAVERNRAAFFRELGAVNKPRRGSRKADTSLWPLVTLRQVHSDIIRRVDSIPEEPLSGDGLITATSGLLLGIQAADCLPVILVDSKRHAIGVFHAGWRGTLKRIVEKGVGEMHRCFGTNPRDLKAAIGPGIQGCCYEVGDEVRTKFESQFEYGASLFREIKESDPVREKYPLLFLSARAPGHSDLPKKIFLDLVEANRQQLLAAGLPAKNIEASPLCTNCHPELLFSYRAEHGKTGRMMGAAGIRE